MKLLIKARLLFLTDFVTHGGGEGERVKGEVHLGYDIENVTSHERSTTNKSPWLKHMNPKHGLRYGLRRQMQGFQGGTGVDYAMKICRDKSGRCGNVHGQRGRVDRRFASIMVVQYYSIESIISIRTRSNPPVKTRRKQIDVATPAHAHRRTLPNYHNTLL